MTKPRRRFDEPPRVLTQAETAGYIGKSPSWLSEHLPELEAMGFPKPVPFLDGYDRAAVDSWLDRLGGLAPGDTTDHSAAWEAAARG